MLDFDPGKSPRVEHHFHVNFIQCMVETDSISRPPPLCLMIGVLCMLMEEEFRKGIEGLFRSGAD